MLLVTTRSFCLQLRISAKRNQPSTDAPLDELATVSCCLYILESAMQMLQNPASPVWDQLISF